ncbi:hypothetical protein [Streptomyces sp. B21-083]|uniref:hypothetical protein n=1 Tax=Streptomyces sp. B21-083 TaxID=3039410 RepID=UPI002FF07702
MYAPITPRSPNQDSRSTDKPQDRYDNSYSEQSVAHLHFHVVPRWPDDGFSTWPTQQSQHQVDGDPVGQLAAAMTASHHTTGNY